MNEERYTPKDGGRLAWLSVLGSFICSGVSMGTINSFGVIYVELLRILEEEKVENAALKTSLVGSLAFGLLLLLSIASGVLCDQLGVRWTTIVGSVIGNLGLLASSWLTNQVEALLFTYSVVYGIGTGLLLTPTIVILSFHFKKRFGLVCGIAGTGGSIFGVIMPAVIHKLLPQIGLSGVFRVLAVMLFASQMLGAATFQVPAEVKLVEVKFPGTNGSQFLMYLSLGTVFSRILVGVIADHPKINTIVLQLGSYITLLGKISTQLCGVQGMAQAFGFLCGFSAIPATAGPAVAGYLFQVTGSYYIPFLICGSTPIIGGLLMVIIYFMKPSKIIEIRNSSSETKAWHEDL
ncbi:hypothetical protein B566_EDAN016169 [Ephemera danica]|nr:hypothetical protein B566_EDAN016169 [Ephemera danica]